MTSTRRRVLAAVAVVAAAGVVWAGAASAAAGRFPTPAATDHATVWAVGDGAYPGPDSRAVARLVQRSRLTSFIYLGDVYDTGSAADFARGYAPTFGRMRAISLPTPGNHEWGNRAVGYNPYWSQVTGGTVPPYYAVSVAGWRLVSANSEMDHGPGSAQVRWLRREMARPGTCKIAFWHRPRYSAGLHGDQADIAPLWNATLGHAAVVLNGHDHDMMRMRPVRGVTEFISGSGGHYRYPVIPSYRFPWWNALDYGALRLDLRPGSAKYAFVSTAGKVLDSGTVRCTVG